MVRFTCPTITSSTLVNNTATSDGGGLFAWGSFSLEQSIVAGNSAGSSKPDIGAHFLATPTSKGYNLIGGAGDLPLAPTDILTGARPDVRRAPIPCTRQPGAGCIHLTSALSKISATARRLARAVTSAR
jgi:hypothetical protein